MNNLSPRNLLVAAALFAIAAESAWAEEAAPSEPAAAAGQTATLFIGLAFAEALGIFAFLVSLLLMFAV